MCVYWLQKEVLRRCWEKGCCCADKLFLIFSHWRLSQEKYFCFEGYLESMYMCPSPLPPPPPSPIEGEIRGLFPGPFLRTMHSNVIIVLAGWETTARPCWQTEFLGCFCWECRTDKNFRAGREIVPKWLTQRNSIELNLIQINLTVLTLLFNRSLYQKKSKFPLNFICVKHNSQCNVRNKKHVMSVTAVFYLQLKM